METKLNAEKLAAKRYPEPKRRVSENLNTLVDRIAKSRGYAAAITEVAQPLQDRVEELEAALEKVIELQYSSRLDEAIDHARAILAKQK